MSVKNGESSGEVAISATSPAAGSYYLKTAILVSICIQNASHGLLSRYSTSVLKESYNTSELVLVAELIKLVVCGYLSLTDVADTDSTGKGLSKLLWLLVHSRKILILVFLYGLCNILAYYALARIEAPVYTVLLQLKILTTASFSVMILGRNVSMAKWRALILLVIGCILVASPTYNRPIDCDNLMSANESASASIASSDLVGVCTVILMVIISGFSAIYFEGISHTLYTLYTIYTL